MLVEILILILTIILAMVETSTWPQTFFYLTIISVILLNMANGVYQNTVYGLAARLPDKYTGAVVLGSVKQNFKNKFKLKEIRNPLRYVEMFYLNSTLNIGILPVLIFQLKVYYKVDRLLTGLTAQQKGTTTLWYSNKRSQEQSKNVELGKSDSMSYC